MIENETAVAPAPTAGDPGFAMELTPDGSALLTVTYGTSITTIQLPRDDAQSLADVVNGFVNWQPAPPPH